MKRWIWLIVLARLAVPALAQDGGGDGGGDFFDLGSGNLGAVAPDFDPLREVRNQLAQANVPPMDKKQEKDLKKVYDREVKLVAKPYEERYHVDLKTAMGALQSQRGSRGAGPGSRGANPGRRGGNSGRRDTPQIVEARRLSQQLVDKMIAELRIDQQGPLRRQQSEQLRIAKWNALDSSMASAGTPLSPTQVTEAQAILARESRLRALMIVEAKGGPYQTQIAQLEGQTRERLVALLDPPQRTAYAEATSSASTPRRGAGASRLPN